MWRNFWGGPEVPVPNIGRVAATPIFGPKISNPANKVKTKHMGALLVATGLLCTRISFFFEIGQKMAELWTKNVCPYMGARAKLSFILPIAWANINIFEWNHFYSISGHRIHILSEYHPFICINVDVRPEKLKIAVISVREIGDSNFTKKPKAFTFFIRFGWNFQYTSKSVFLA